MRKVWKNVHMMGREQLRKVDTFDLSNIREKSQYEFIMNNYPIIGTEFAYMKDGTPKVTIWYLKEEAED